MTRGHGGGEGLGIVQTKRLEGLTGGSEGLRGAVHRDEAQRAQ